MNELTKTSIFIAIAVVLLLFAWLVQPRERSGVNDDIIGSQLLENFKDPSQIKDLQIVKYIPKTGDLIDFRVAETGGKWCLPSHQNYPADAEKQMGLVASDFVDQKVLDIAYKDAGNTDVREMHTTYGVLDPESKNLGLGDGVGVKVKFTGENQRILAAIIIGKEVEGTGGRQSYVRVPDQNTVYVMGINKDHLSTKFDDWIENNLLDINSFDLKSVRMQDYSTELVETLQGVVVAPKFHSFYKVTYNSEQFSEKWQLETLKRIDPLTGQSADVTLAPEEMLNQSKLEEMRQAFGDLKIIDVLRKPESIAAAQRAGDDFFVKSSEDIEALDNVGYILDARPREDGVVAIRFYSRQGEVFINMNDGIVYHLMFGNLTGTNIAENATASTPESETGDESTADTGSSAATSVLSANRYLMILAEFDESIVEKPAPIPLTEVPEEGDEEEIAKLQQQRESDERYNKQLEDNYVDAIDAGKRRAQELNLRFADWFFVISDDVFKKIHVTDTDLVTRPGQFEPDPGYNAGLDMMIDAFNDGLSINDDITYPPVDVPQVKEIEEQDFPSGPQGEDVNEEETVAPPAEPIIESEPVIESEPAA